MEHNVLPFFMTYPMPMAYEDEDAMLRDLEYFQQMYPVEAKGYQKKVRDILDKMDYEGSMIYDQFPDRFSMYQLAKTVTDIIRKEEEQQDGANPEKWVWVGNMIQIILVYEVYKKRHKSDRGVLRFF